MCFDQIGFGLRSDEGGNRFYGQHGGEASLLGHMVKDVRAAVDFLVCRGPQRRNASLCSENGYTAAVGPYGIGRIPVIDTGRIYLAGYALGGNVALHAAALDPRVAGVASFAGFTPMRTDAAARPTGGLRRPVLAPIGRFISARKHSQPNPHVRHPRIHRLWELHALVPKLGWFADRPAAVPYDYDELLGALAPRPALVYAPLGDRDATAADVRRCVDKARAAWGTRGQALAFKAPDAVTKMEAPEAAAAVAWFKSLLDRT